MAHWKPVDQIQDLVNKLGGDEQIPRILSGELVVVEKTPKVSSNGLVNGGITYATGLDTEKFLADWTEFYFQVYGITADLSAVPLPPIRSGFGWGVPVISAMAVQPVFEKCLATFPSWKYAEASLDDVVPVKNDERTTADGAYVIWCRDRVEADEELKNLSANQIKERKLTTMTLLERLLLEQWFFWKTQGHLDLKNYTNCTGSRDSGGRVPGVYFHGGGSEVGVHWCSVDLRVDLMRSREVVSLG